MEAVIAVPKTQRRYAVACHLAAAGGLIVPWFGFALGPLLAWIALRREHPAVEAHGREALNFNLSMMLWMAIVAGVAWVLGSIAWFLPPALLVLWLACVVMAAVKAGEGDFYRYPVTIRFLA